LGIKLEFIILLYNKLFLNIKRVPLCVSTPWNYSSFEI